MTSGTQSWHERLWRLFKGTLDEPTGSIRVSHDRGSQFGEFITASRTPIIELNSSYGTSALRDVIEVTGSGAIGTSEGTVSLETGTTTGSRVSLFTAEIGRYIPGYSAEFGIGVRIPAPLTGDQEVIWGGRGPSGDNGFLWGYDAAGLFIAILRGGTRIATFRQSEWNQDKMDGTGLSGFDLDMSQGLIFQVEYTWYGYGLVTFGVLGTVTDSDGRQRQAFLPCHHYRPSGQTSVEQPNIRVFTEATNGATTGNVQVYVGGRQFSIVGQYVPKFRFSHAWSPSVTATTTYTPLASLRRKTAFSNRSLKLEGFEFLGAQAEFLVAVFLNPTLTGGTWVNPAGHTAAETAMEANTDATAMTGGLLVWQSLVQGGANVNQAILNQQTVNIDIPHGQILTLAARTLTSTGAARGALRVKEEW